MMRILEMIRTISKEEQGTVRSNSMINSYQPFRRYIRLRLHGTGLPEKYTTILRLPLNETIKCATVRRKWDRKVTVPTSWPSKTVFRRSSRPDETQVPKIASTPTLKKTYKFALQKPTLAPLILLPQYTRLCRFQLQEQGNSLAETTIAPSSIHETGMSYDTDIFLDQLASQKNQ
jgi:hypothetical protein